MKIFQIKNTLYIVYKYSEHPGGRGWLTYTISSEHTTKYYTSKASVGWKQETAEWVKAQEKYANMNG